MKWIGFSGSWRNNSPKLKNDVRIQAQCALKAGNGIVTGGALGVDYPESADIYLLVVKF